jgi:hypothetical protein
MQDFLKDIIQHTHGLGVVDLVKVTGTESDTIVNAVAENRSVIVEAKFSGPVADFIGVFGMPNMGKLNTIINIGEYKEDAVLNILKQDKTGEDGTVTSLPVGIHFENKSGDFKNDYRFMVQDVINDRLKTVKFKGVKWGVEIEPSVLGIQRLKFQAQANSEEETFIAKTDKGNLVFYFGDHSSHAGNFVFASSISGSLSKAWNWPVGVVISILNLPGDKVVRFSDEGAAQITVDSGIAVWTYTIPAQTK